MKKKLMGIVIGAVAGMMVFGTTAFAANVTEADAKKTALAAVNLTEDQVVFVKSGMDFDDGREIFDVDFIIPGEVKFEFDIDANTGSIVGQDRDLWDAEDSYEYAALLGEKGMTAAETTGAVTELQAKAVALKDSNLRDDEVSFTKCRKDFDDGIARFEIEFRTADGTEYDYDISESDGRILEKNIDRDFVFGFDDDDDDFDFDFDFD